MRLAKGSATYDYIISVCHSYTLGLLWPELCNNVAYQQEYSLIGTLMRRRRCWKYKLLHYGIRVGPFWYDVEVLFLDVISVRRLISRRHNCTTSHFATSYYVFEVLPLRRIMSSKFYHDVVICVRVQAQLYYIYYSTTATSHQSTRMCLTLLN